MRRCLALAHEAAGNTAPNPLVGAVIVGDDGTVIAEGFHKRAGEPHAEAVALKAAGSRANGKTIYVNLEPCCHQGRTPPCANALIEAGIKKVVVGALDPNPKVAGGGIALLKARGLEVVTGVLREECRYINRGFFKSMQRQLPWLDLKLAATLDGRIADYAGTSRYITSTLALEYVQGLRAEADCILVGAHTALHDNPRLNLRGETVPDDKLQPVRAVIDTHGKIFSQDRCYLLDGSQKTVVFTDEEDAAKLKSRERTNLEIVAVPHTANGLLNLKAALSISAIAVCAASFARAADSWLVVFWKKTW
jgi:riboflavin biosynthesis protein RibD